MDTTEVRSEHRFDVDKLHRHLVENVEEFPKSNNSIEVKQYRSGQSNPTFFLQKDGMEFVLRKKPPGKLLRGAHQIDREFRIQSALYSIGFPVPKQYFYCRNTNIIGTEFYLMQHVRGRIFRNASLPGCSPKERLELFQVMNHTLAKLHQINWQRLKLHDFGKAGNYCKRQISTWSKQYKASQTSHIESMDKLLELLPLRLPTDEDITTIIHGDYKVDNIPHVLAVLDWELSTLGHPYIDFAYNCILYNMIETKKLYLYGNMSDRSKVIPGMPTEKEYIAWYCHAMNITPPISHYNFYLALSLFKMASILQGVYARFIQGIASAIADKAESVGSIVEPIADKALLVLTRLDSEIKWNTISSVDDILPVLDSCAKSPKGQEIYNRVKRFMKEHVYPAEVVFEEQLKNSTTKWFLPQVLKNLWAKAKEEGLWNLFIQSVSGLTHLDSALIAEEVGTSPIGPLIFNKNSLYIDLLDQFGTNEQKMKWVKPLLDGEVTSAIAMTETNVASSDPTSLECSIKRVGENYVVNGTKWWISGAGDPRLKLVFVLGKTGDDIIPRHKRHSIVIVPVDTPGFKIGRSLQVFGYQDVPFGHMELHFNNVRVPVSNILLGEGRGFEVVQSRLGPARLQHCMRQVGVAERVLEMICDRAQSRSTFGKNLAQQGVVRHQIAECRLGIEQIRLLTLRAAHTMDTYGCKAAKKQIAMAFVATPRTVKNIIDTAIQIHGGAGVCQDYPFWKMFSQARAMQISYGSDEVHLMAIAKDELKQQQSRL
uniref:Acyl-CoA dehydrogenase family member 11 n=1 Tax=Saccoglossus kowalevskii TaxID=10224 RepID=A0ABM0MRT7_SACKO|nr:PREDICTED: acyl-CoA dehydrogenase family member 11-like [Saccoglossus kowalevskii]